MSKKLKGLLLALVLCLQVVVPASRVEAATVLYNNATGYEGNYAYELWKDYGDTSMTLKGNGLFECWWENIGNALFRKGVKWDCTQTYSQLGNITVNYGVDYQPNGNSYLCVYGWCRNPLVEYYIVDSWGTWRPPGATSKGTITVDGGTYEVYETTRVNQPSIDGNTTFQQYWSVRTSKRTSGTISVTEHFKAWERMGMKMGLMYEAALTVEGYQSSGWADVYQLDITVGGNGSSGSSSGGNSSGDSASSAPGTNKGTEIECESMTKSGQYTGTISNPFNGVALYGNDDAVSTTVNFSSGTHDFSLRGASNGDELAEVDLYIGGEKKGTFYYGDANIAEYTIKGVTHGTGNQKVELRMTADTGNWDLYADCLIIGGDGVSAGGSQGGNTSGGNQGGNTGNQGGNTSGGTTNTGATMECEDMTKSGQYTGNVSSPFNGVALYANDDAVSYTQNFTSGTNTFILTGASNGDNMARVDLFIDGQNKGTFYYGDANVAEYVIEDVSTGTGNKKVELKVTADDGTWDAYIDKLTINGGAASGGNTGDNSGNTGDNSGNQGGNTSGGDTGNQGGNTSGSTTNTGATMECEDMTKSGQYTGNVSSPFNGVALYANDDAVSYTQNFTSGTNTFTLTGASNNDNMAQVDLYIGNEKKGTFYYGDANVADFVIENVSTGTGNKTVKLVVSTDNGQWDAYIDKLTINGGAASGGNTGDNSGNTGSDSGNQGGNTGNNSGSTDSSATVKECEDMTKSGQYTGNVSSPFSGVALYANNDAVSYTQNFAYGSHDFTLRGASNGDNMARVDLVIGNETKGTFYFGDANVAEYTISNVSHATGNQTVKLVVTADDGQWDAYIDSLTISPAGSVDTDNGSQGGNTGNQGGNQGGNGSAAVTIETTTPSQLLSRNWNVQYGEMKKTQYWSNTCEKYRNVIVLLPPNYDSSKKYPVMYALHGLNQDETYLIGDGNSGFRIMLGNMIDQGLAEEMIVVFPYIFASKTMDQASGFDDVSFAAYDNFINELTNDLMPYIKRTYSVAEGRENTAITGFSMGGRESLYIGYKLQNQIGYVGAIAPAPGLTPANDWASSHKGMISESEFKFAQDPYALMICCGTADSVVGTFPKSYHDILTRNGESHYWWEIQGSDHGDPAVTNGLYNFCKALFK